MELAASSGPPSLFTAIWNWILGELGLATVSQSFTASLAWQSTPGPSLEGETITFEYAVKATTPSWKSAGSATTNASLQASKTIKLNKNETYLIKALYVGNKAKFSNASSTQITFKA